jgi:reverse gyrase
MKPVSVIKYIEKIKIPEINKEIELSGVKDIIDHGWDLVFPFRINIMKIQPIPNGIRIVEAIGKKVPKVRLYSQADIINLMRERKIGRPSTYAIIVKKVMERGYVINKGNNLIPTKLGIDVYNFLEKNFGDFVSEKRTRDLEEIMDKISENREDYRKVLENIYEETNMIIEKGKNIQKE